jgi:hypothetical protein
MPKLHLADYIISHYKWYDYYAQTNRLDNYIMAKELYVSGVRKNSWIKITNWGFFLLFILILIIFPSTLYTLTMYLMLLGVVLIWAFNYFMISISRKHTIKRVLEWWEINKDDEKFWNTLDIQLIDNYGLKK